CVAVQCWSTSMSAAEELDPSVAAGVLGPAARLAALAPGHRGAWSPAVLASSSRSILSAAAPAPPPSWRVVARARADARAVRSSSSESTEIEEHTSELQSRFDLVCRLLLAKKKQHRST